MARSLSIRSHNWVLPYEEGFIAVDPRIIIPQQWSAALEEDMEFSQEELLRCNRQLIIPDIGETGQQKLRDAKVFAAGVGGLGSLSSYYLAAAGIGRLKIVDLVS